MRVTTGAAGGGGGGGGSGVPAIQALADPIFLSSFALPADVTAGLWDIDLAIARFNAAAPFTAGSISWLKFDQIARVVQLPGFSSVTAVGFNQANPQTISVPSECSLRITGAGSGGIIQCKGSNPGSVSLLLQSGGPNNHGLLDIEDIWAMGDPTLTAGVADSAVFMRMSSVFVLNTRRFRIYGFLGAINVLDYRGGTSGKQESIQLCGCGALASGGAQASNVHVEGFEFTWGAYGWINNTTAPPANVPTPSNKNVAATPWILRDTSVGAANFSGAGDWWVEMQAGDVTSGALVVNPDVSGAGSGVGPQHVINFYAEANCAGASGSGALTFQDVQGGVYIEGGRVRLNGATTTPAVSFLGNIPNVEVKRQRVDFGFGYFFGNTGGAVGDAKFEQCSTDQVPSNIPIILETATIAGVGGTAASPPNTLRVVVTGEVQTTNAAQTATLFSIPLPRGMSFIAISNFVAVGVTAPSGGSIGDTFLNGGQVFGGKNVGGVLTTYGPTGGSTSGDATMTTLTEALTTTAGPPALVNVVVNQHATVANTNNWSGKVEAVYAAVAP